MVYVIARPSNKYTGYYKDSRGKVRSAGTFDSENEAMLRATDKDGTGTPLPRVTAFGHRRSELRIKYGWRAAL